MNYNILFLGMAVSLLVLIPPADADNSDTQQPITIESNHAELDEKKEISIYTGDVILMQGGIKITADNITVYAKNGALQRITAEGKPVKYIQHREELDDIYATSLHMEYVADKKRYIFIDQAELQQGKNRFSGTRIQFDPDEEKVIASGDAVDSSNAKQRVQITIQPGNNEKKPNNSKGSK